MKNLITGQRDAIEKQAAYSIRFGILQNYKMSIKMKHEQHQHVKQLMHIRCIKHSPSDASEPVGCNKQVPVQQLLPQLLCGMGMILMEEGNNQQQLRQAFSMP